MSTVSVVLLGTSRSQGDISKHLSRLENRRYGNMILERRKISQVGLQMSQLTAWNLNVRENQTAVWLNWVPRLKGLWHLGHNLQGRSQVGTVVYCSQCAGHRYLPATSCAPGRDYEKGKPTSSPSLVPLLPLVPFFLLVLSLCPPGTRPLPFYNKSYTM